MIKYQWPGEEVTFGSPPPAPNGDFRRDNLRAAAAGIGATYEQTTGDLSQVNYSSIRAGLVEHRAWVEQEQWMQIIPMLIAPVRKRWREIAIIAGIRVGKQPDDILPPKRAWVDPLKDVMAAKEEVKAGWRSDADVIREMGNNPDDVLADIGEHRAKLKDKGIVVDTDAEVSDLKLSPLDAAKATQ